MDTDCFDKRYYWLNRKLLIAIGQWPDQYHADRVKMWLLYLGVILILPLTQLAKVVTTEMTFDLWIEIFTDELLLCIAVIRYFTFTIFNDKIKTLFNSMQMNWKSLLDEDECRIFGESAEKGRLYILRYGMFVFFLFLSGLALVYAPSILKLVHSINDSTALVFPYPAEYFVDQQKYYHFILIHMLLVFLVSVVGALITDMFYMTVMFHAVGIFTIACFRLEHAFDNCMEKSKYASGRSNVCERIARAVESHRNAVRFCDHIIAAYEWPNLISLLLVLISISATLYWSVSLNGQETKMLYGILLGVGLMIHVFIMDIPAQRMTDSSVEIIFKAYSSLWYVGQTREQTLLILAMQRGLRPSAMIIGRMYPATLENFGNEMKASFSYFTMLVSLK